MENTMYNSMISANQLLNKQEIIAHNLANISTNGFKENLIYFINQENYQNNYKNTFSNVQQKQYYNSSTGLLDYTNRNLDVFIEDRNGWLVVKDANGKEAYTRNGHITISPYNELTIQNYKIVGYNNYIKIPKKIPIKILSNGVIINSKNKNNSIEKGNFGKLKLVHIPENQLIQKDNGLYYIKKNHIYKNIISDNNIKIKSGILEKSNVNATKNMIDMISNARQFEMQMKMISMCDQNTEYANQILNINS